MLVEKAEKAEKVDLRVGGEVLVEKAEKAEKAEKTDPPFAIFYPKKVWCTFSLK